MITQRFIELIFNNQHHPFTSSYTNLHTQPHTIYAQILTPSYIQIPIMYNTFYIEQLNEVKSKIHNPMVTSDTKMSTSNKIQETVISSEENYQLW